MRRRLEPQPFLAPLGWLYLALAGIHHRGFDLGLRRARRVDAGVISVGNLCAGGTGKTPAVAWLAERLSAAGHRVGIVSRGHGGRREQDPLLVSRSGEILATAREAGDEPLLLARLDATHAVTVGHDRVAAARVAVDAGADLLLLDDGFQHRRLGRDLDLLLLDAEDPLGGGRGLPAGYLREPRRGMRRADVILLTRAEPSLVTRQDPVPRASWPSPITELFGDRPAPTVLAAGHRPRHLIDDAGRIRSLAALDGTRVLAVSGIARPRAFESTLNALGARVVAHLARDDHHVYDDADAAEIGSLAGEHRAEMIVTTEKDRERWPASAPAAHVLAIELEIGAEALLLDLVRERLDARGDAP